MTKRRSPERRGPSRVRGSAVATNDHIVPRMYLKRFSQIGRGSRIMATLVDEPGKAFVTSTRNVGSEKGFYWGTGPDGAPSHDVEEMLGRIETDATPAFRALLDSGNLPTENALPGRWPPLHDTRVSVAWWMAAQIVRTAPQRERLVRLGTTPLEPGRSLSRADGHLSYMVQAMGPLAQLLYNRPWGFGFTNLCLLTSDVPVQIANIENNDEPVDAASYWDIYLPLDPHRFLYLPGAMHDQSPRLMRDHLISLPGGLAIGLNQMVVETAHRHLLWHPDHDPRKRIQFDHAIAQRESRREGRASKWVMNYSALESGLGIERRWLSSHTWDQPDGAGTPSKERTTDEVIRHASRMTQRLQLAENEFRKGLSDAGDERPHARATRSVVPPSLATGEVSD